MLHFHPLTNVADAAAYFSAADYHFEGAEQTAYTLGNGAQLLGLPEGMTPDMFKLLLDGRHPESEAKLTKAKGVREIGMDMTISNVKSVSLAKYLGDDKAIGAAEKEAVTELFGIMERDAETRVRKKGAFHNRNTANLMAVAFPHDTTRPMNGQPDPQSHTHVVLLNLTFDKEEGEWKAADFGNLLESSGYYNAVYRSLLANKLEGIGYTIRRTPEAFEIAGIPERAIKEFSRRTDQIEGIAAKLDTNIKGWNPDATLSAEAKAKLGATTREAKTKGLTWDGLVKRWESRLQPGELDAIKAAKSDKVVPLHQPDADKRAVELALEHLLDKKSVARDREVVRHALHFGIASGATPDGVWKALGGKSIIRRDDMVTTKTAAGEEKQIVDFAMKGRGKCRPLGNFKRGVSGSDRLTMESDSKLSPADENTATLTPSQQDVFEHVLTSPDRLITYRGAAGTGKTYLTQAVLKEVSVPWVILAPTAKASRDVLRGDGFAQADTLAKFLNDRDMQEKVRGGLVLLDESGLAGVKDVAKLTQLAVQLNARIVMAGDRRQLKSVGRGDVLGLLQDRAMLPMPEISDIKRQTGEYLEAARLLADGRINDGVSKLDGMGWVKPTGDYSGVVNEYAEALQKGEVVRIICPTHKEGKIVSDHLRDWLKAEGRIGKDDVSFTRLVPLSLTSPQIAAGDTPEGAVLQLHKHAAGRYAGTRIVANSSLQPDYPRLAGAASAYRSEPIALAVGDDIRSTAGIKTTDGKRIDTGAVLHVDGFTDAGEIRVTTGSGAKRTLPADVGHINHNYVNTEFAAQGATVNKVITVIGNASLPAVTNRGIYVDLTRGRYAASLYVQDIDAARKQWNKETSHAHAFDLLRAPPKKVRQRLKKYVSFLREKTRDVAKQFTKQTEKGLNYELG